MNILVACEESQRVCQAFRSRGHRAFSCDLQPCSGGHPEWHIRGDVLQLINGCTEFRTMDGEMHEQIGAWDLLIAHPPCTYLSAAGAVRLYDAEHNIKDRGRDLCGWKARKFFYEIWDSCAPRLCIENPVPLSRYALPRYTQIIQPYEFGDPWKKRTCLWLRGLNQLEPTNIVDPIGYWIGAHGHDKAKKGVIKGFRDQKTRSKTFPGIARAMAKQWG